MVALDRMDRHGDSAILACSSHYSGSLEARDNKDRHIPPSSVGLVSQVGSLHVGDTWPECQWSQRWRCLLVLVR